MPQITKLWTSPQALMIIAASSRKQSELASMSYIVQDLTQTLRPTAEDSLAGSPQANTGPYAMTTLDTQLLGNATLAKWPNLSNRT